jgi:ankyrin repeat protein
MFEPDSLPKVLSLACEFPTTVFARAVLMKMKALDVHKDAHVPDLSSAARYGRRDLVEAISNMGVNLGYDPLLVACRAGRIDIVKHLLSRGAQVDPPKDCCSHKSALGEACHRGHKEIVHLLLNAGAKTSHSGKQGISALEAAAEGGQPEIFDLLRARGIQPTRDEIIDLACCGGSIRILKQLLDFSAKRQRQFPLHLAARHNQLAAAEWILKQGVAVDSEGCLGRGGALKEACREGHTAMSVFLLENGADIHMPTCEYFESALQTAASRGRLETIRSLVEYGVDVNTVGPYGPAIIFAIKRGDYEVIKFLLEKGADVNLPNSWQKTPLDIALERVDTR